MKRLAWALIILAAALFAVTRPGGATRSLEAASESPQAPGPVGGKRTPVIVELFTSEGCSDCPPADALLTKLDQTQPVPGAEVIVLEEHVDYWDHQGWADPFSSAEFTRRQNDYANVFRNSSVYTPQMVVDGKFEFVGSREGAARQAIGEASRMAKTTVNLRLAGNADKPGIPLEVRIEKLAGATAGERADVFLTITESRLHSDVVGGENSGRKCASRGSVCRAPHCQAFSQLESFESSSRGFHSGTAQPAHSWRSGNSFALIRPGQLTGCRSCCRPG